MGYRCLERHDAKEIAVIHRNSIFWAIENFPNLHSPTDDIRFFEKELINSTGYAYLGSDGLIQGFILWRENWINHLYLDPNIVRNGIGSELLNFALLEIQEPSIQLYTFQSNEGAVAFYFKHGFKIVSKGDGSGNEEGFPDYLLTLNR